MASIVREKSYAFAIRVVMTCKELRARREYILSSQLLRSGTAIGALVREAQHAESRADFIHKMSLALKEANETAYWIDLLQATDQLPSGTFLRKEAGELLRLVSSIVKTTKERTVN